MEERRVTGRPPGAQVWGSDSGPGQKLDPAVHAHAKSILRVWCSALFQFCRSLLRGRGGRGRR